MSAVPPGAVTAAAVSAATDAIISHMGRVPRLLTRREHAQYVASLALIAAEPHIAAAAWRDGYGLGRDDEAVSLPLREYQP